MIQTKTDALYKKVLESYENLKNVKSLDERLAVANYIGNLYCSMVTMGDISHSFDKYDCFGGKKKYRRAIQKLDVYSNQLMDNYILQKEFHKNFLGEILPDIEDEMMWIIPLSFQTEETFSKNDFFDVLFQFLKSIRLESLFDQFYKGNHIYSTLVGQSELNLGSTIYDPISRESDIFITDFQYDFKTLNTLVHELGHGYDLNRFLAGLGEYNQYFYNSFYGETISRLFERLFFRYLIQNNIRKDTAKDKLIDFEDLNHSFLLDSYILSLFDDEFLLEDQYLNCDKDEIISKIKDYFIKDAPLEEFVSELQNLDLQETYTYAYGDIISMFLVEEVEKSGFTGELFEYFLSQRSALFSDQFMRECGFGPANYLKKYKKEVELIKK